jgi:hypothetical protein
MGAKDSWLGEVRTLLDATKPQPATQYAADGLIAVPSVNIIYGAPASMKSLIMADLAVCVAAGREWLPPLPDDKSGIEPIKTMGLPALWLDFDNGAHRTNNRLAAFAKTYGAEAAPFYILSMPAIGFDATRTGLVVEMIDFVGTLGAHFVVVDNLLTISGGKDENSPEIGQVMTNLRLLSEKTQSAVNVIHHARKQSGFKGGLGDDLRGHSSIRGAVDLALFVEREEGADIINVRSTKSRDVDPEPFAALFTYTHIPGTRDLDTAAFWGQRASGVETTADVERAIIDALLKVGKPLSQADLVKAVQSAGLKAGRDRIRSIAARLAQSLRINVTSGPRGAVLYHA